MGNAERIWTWLMVGILSFFGVFCLISSIQKYVSSRKKLNAERERAENLQELREIARENRVRLQQDAPQNAPDARETRPPCYEDAILLPKLDAASFASLDELMLRGKRKKRRRRRRSSGTDAKDDDDDEEERIQLRQRSRTRSEDVLSRRIDNSSSGPTVDIGRSIYERPTSTRVVDQADIMIHTSGLRRSGTQEERDREEDEELHYHSIDILSLHHQPSSASARSGPAESIATSSAPPARTSSSLGPTEQIENFTAYSHSPYAKRKVKPLQHINPNGSIEEITDFADRRTSPYAKRRNPLQLSSFRKLPPLPDVPPPPVPTSTVGTSTRTSEINLVENYFEPADQNRLLMDELDDYAVIPMQIFPPTTKEPQPSTSRVQPVLLQPADLLDDARLNTSDSSETTSSVSIEMINPTEVRK